MSTLRLIRAKLQATTIFSGGAFRDLARRDQLWILPLAGVGVAASLGMMEYLLYANYRVLLLVGAQVGKPQLVFSFAVLASWLLVFLLGIPVVVSIFFFSRDTPMLLPLPIPARSIVLADAFLVYLFSFGMGAIVTAPAVLAYGMATPVGAWFCLCVVLLLLAAPLLPVGLAVLFAFALTGVVNLSRRRMLLEVAGSFLVVGALIAVQVAMQRSFMSEATGGFALPAALAERLIAVPQALPPLVWIADAFVLPRGAPALLGFVALSCAVAAFALALGGRFFLRLTVERAAARSTPISASRYRALRVARTPVRALFAREVAILTSNSTFLMEGVMEGLVFPLMLGIFSLTLPREMKEMAGQFVAASPWAGLAVMALLVLMTGINTVSSTSISREGRTFALSLVLPVPGRLHIRGKLGLHLLIFGTGYLVDLAILFIVLRCPLVSLVYLLPGGAGFLLLSFCVSIFLDLRRPSLAWTHPQQAMKQNMNAIVSVGVTFLLVALHAGIALGLWAFGLSPLAAGIAVALLSLGEAFAALSAIDRYADRRYAAGLEAAA